ncbi:neutral zinc metallopeptidase [Kineococcus esterisolvens]|uniref:hypothetical protein n=1 Tax=unclassified Kineococcus TaxID=2621656 RepID=UPI003D7E603A
MSTLSRWSVAAGTGLVLALGCVAPAASAAASPVPRASSAAAPAGAVSAAEPVRAVADVRLPVGWQARRESAAARTGVQSPVSAVVGRAIDPGEHDCSPTALSVYAEGLLAGLDPQELRFVADSGVLDFPTYDALLFGTDGDPAYALTSSSRSELERTFRSAQRFWDVPSADVQLMAMHGSVLRDPARLARLLTVLYGLPAAEAREYSAQVVAAVESVPELAGGENPVFTLNAYAFSAQGATDPLVASLPDKIVFGDGILAFMSSIGLSDVGPRAVLAHEFAHHVQYEDDLFDSPLTGPEATRRTELMADAFATYFATHKRGAALNAKRVVQAQRSFAEVGDCSFTSPGHHGTPNQRERAAQWGADLAASQREQGHVLPSLQVAERFEAALAELVAPDAR